MSDDRPDVPNVPVAQPRVPRFRGIPEPLNQDTTTIFNTVTALKEVVETLAGERGDESNAAVLFRHLFPEGVAGDDANLFDYYLRRDTHLALDGPLYLDHPHPQYWHKVIDFACAHLYFQNATPIILSNGQVFSPFDADALTPWQLVTSPAAGTITIQSNSEYPVTGVYQLSLTGVAEGLANTDYILAMYKDGVATPVLVPAFLKGQSTSMTVAWSGVVDIVSPGVLDIRLHTGDGLSIYSLNWSLNRVSSIQGTVGDVGD